MQPVDVRTTAPSTRSVDYKRSFSSSSSSSSSSSDIVEPSARKPTAVKKRKADGDAPSKPKKADKAKKNLGISQAKKKKRTTAAPKTTATKTTATKSHGKNKKADDDNDDTLNRDPIRDYHDVVEERKTVS